MLQAEMATGHATLCASKRPVDATGGNPLRFGSDGGATCGSVVETPTRPTRRPPASLTASRRARRHRPLPADDVTSLISRAGKRKRRGDCGWGSFRNDHCCWTPPGCRSPCAVHLCKRAATGGAIGISLAFVFPFAFGIRTVAGWSSLGSMCCSHPARAWRAQSARSPQTSCRRVRAAAQGAPRRTRV